MQTVFALCVLRARFASEEPVWRRAHRKGVAFLAKALSSTEADVANWLEEVAKSL